MLRTPLVPLSIVLRGAHSFLLTRGVLYASTTVAYCGVLHHPTLLVYLVIVVLHRRLVKGELVAMLVSQSLVIVPRYGGHDSTLKRTLNVFAVSIEDALHDMVRSCYDEKEDILQADQRKGRSEGVPPP